MRRLLILADDLTGAADCANAFATHGLSATVIFEDTGEHVCSDVLAVDCDTRHLSPEDAAARVTQITRNHILNNPDLPVFKKVDSTLRGNVGTELRAVLEERRLQADRDQRIVAIMAPAFPAGGRTTINGYQMVHGIPLNQTETWNHNRLFGAAHIPAMLQTSGLRTILLALESVRSGPNQLSTAMQHASLESDVLVCDAENDDDLKAIAQASITLGARPIWAGSAGLAYQLPRAARLSTSTPPPHNQLELSTAPILFVVGSMSTVSHRQAAMLERTTTVTSIHIQPGILLDGPSHAAWAAIATRTQDSLRAGHDTLLVLDANEHVDASEERRLIHALGLMLVPYAKIVGALVATGGETARAILRGWGATSLVLLGEVEPGLPYSFAKMNNRRLPVLTKAGAFGNDDTLISCREFLCSRLRKRDHAPARKSS